MNARTRARSWARILAELRAWNPQLARFEGRALTLALREQEDEILRGEGNFTPETLAMRAEFERDYPDAPKDIERELPPLK